MPRVLIAVADGGARAELRALLGTMGIQHDDAETFADAAHVLRTTAIDIAIIDDQLAGAEKLDVLAMTRRIDDRVPIIELVAAGREAPARGGAEYYITRPIDRAALQIAVHRLVEVTRTRRRSVAFSVLEHRRGLDPFVGESAAIQELAAQAHQVLDSHAPVLVQGETGTGKGVLAAWLHHHGPRAEEAFVDINCAGLSREFVESELFGHERGAFTGAIAPKLGLLDLAHRGTAFLDEIGEIDLTLQPRLLKVLEEKRFRRLGDVRDHVVDIRLIAATNRNLARRAKDGTFRADLLYRINTISLTVPSLRARREDIPVLARRIANGLGHDIDFSTEALRAMEAYEWPGNVRELRNVIERAILISNRASRITPNELRFEVGGHDEPHTSGADGEEPGTLEDAERRHIERVMRFENGSVERAAARLGVSRSTLYQKLRRHRIVAKQS